MKAGLLLVLALALGACAGSYTNTYVPVDGYATYNHP